MPKMNVEGLQCDNPTCDWIDMSIKREQYDELVGAKCPKCGAVILTEEDFKTVVLMEKIVKVVNIFTWPFEKRMKKWSHTDVKMNGSGKVEFSEVSEVENPYYEGE